MAQVEVTGLFQWLKFGTAGAGAATAFGIVDGGNLTVDPDRRKRMGIGGYAIRRGGVVKPAGAATFYVTSTNQSLLAKCFRASYPRGALTGFDIAGGTDEWELDYANAKVNTYSIDYAQGAGLKATIDWMALSVDSGAGSTMTAEANLDFEDYEFVATFEGNEYSVQSFGIKGNNNLVAHTAANTKAAGVKRLPMYFLYGPEELTVDITGHLPFPHATLDLWEDTLPSNLGAILTGTNGVNTNTFTFTNLQPGSSPFNLVDGNTPVTWTYNFDGDPGGGSMAYTWA